MDAVRQDYSASFRSDGRHASGSTDENEKEGYAEALAQNPKQIHRLFDKPMGTGRNFRNTDLYFQSISEPHGLICAGDEIVGLDANSSQFKGKHFATFPERLVEPLILAGSSERGCCPKCGATWRRVTKKHDKGLADRKFRSPHEVATDGMTNGQGATTLAHVVETETLGWQPTCQCDVGDPTPCTVLDCFNGAGTTGAVALKLGRNYIGVDLNRDYLDLTIERLEPLLSQPSLNLEAR